MLGLVAPCCTRGVHPAVNRFRLSTGSWQRCWVSSRTFRPPRRPRTIAMASEPQQAPLAADLPPKAAEEPAGMEAEASLLQAFASLPAVGRGWAAPAPGGSARVTLQLSQRNLPANSQRKYLLSFGLSEAALEAGELDASLPLEQRDVLLMAPSPSGRRTLIVRVPAGNGGEGPAAILEVWGASRLLSEVQVPRGLHGSVYNDGWFADGAAWSPDEARVAYVAEAPPATKTPDWGTRQGADGKKYEGAGPKGWRGQGEWTEDWGELNTGKRPPALFVLDCGTWTVEAVRGLPEDSSCGQPVWSPDGEALVFVAWPHASATFPGLPLRLGIVFCYNRPCALHALRWPQRAAPRAARLTPHPGSAFSPRFDPGGRRLVFLSQHRAVETGVHSATGSLWVLDWHAAQRAVADGGALPSARVIVDVVRAPASPTDFPGLYCNALPAQPFVGRHTLLATSQWRSLAAVVSVDLRSGAVSRASPDNGASWSVVAAGADGWVLASESRPSQPGSLYAAHALSDPDPAHPGGWCWSPVPVPGLGLEEAPPQVRAALADIGVETVQLPEGSASTGGAFEAVVIYSKSAGGPRPGFVTPHGGPHTAYTAQFFMPISYMVSLGYTAVLLNYRGSTGFGEDALQSLPGRIGRQDVDDCLAGLQAAVARGHLDPARVAVVGGSHGGFLTGHLAGQAPDLFKAAVLRNPVCDLSLMVSVSDIPDWCYVEAWGPEEGRRRARLPPSMEDLARFREVSPISHADKVRAPLLVLLGARDRRVPLDDAKRYAAALRALPDGGPRARVHVFPEDAHGLDKPQTEFEQWLAAAWWLKAHL